MDRIDPRPSEEPDDPVIVLSLLRLSAVSANLFGMAVAQFAQHVADDFFLALGVKLVAHAAQGPNAWPAAYR